MQSEDDQSIAYFHHETNVFQVERPQKESDKGVNKDVNMDQPPNTSTQTLNGQFILDGGIKY